MSSEYIFRFIHFVPLDAKTPKFFGFSEFLSALALMVLAWTIADVRYRFRVKITPLPLQRITFSVVASIGILTLLNDLWRAEKWPVLQGNFMSQSVWQALLGCLFLLTFLTWAWFAFIKPPVYNKRNAFRYGETLFEYILRGSPAELSIIADELKRSVRNLIQYATDIDLFEKKALMRKQVRVTDYADDILLLIGDKRFCRAIIESSPSTALIFFEEISKTKKYSVKIDSFAKNIVNEALMNKDSFLFHETEGYDSGLIGYYKPLSNAIFSNYRMVEQIGSLLDLDFKNKLDAAHWEAYCRIVLITFRDYVEKDFLNHSFTLYRAFGYIKESVSDLYKIDGVDTRFRDDDIQKKLLIIVNFIRGAIEVLEKKGVPKNFQLRVQKIDNTNTFYDHIARMIFEVIFTASAVRSPAEQSWAIQYVSIWSRLFILESGGQAAKVVNFKVRRLLYDEIVEMKRFPNFKGARILSYCLNVMGFIVRESDYRPNTIALQKAVLSWTKKNFIWLHSYNSRVAEECLSDGLYYDEKNQRLVKAYPAEGLRREPKYIYLNLNPPSQSIDG